MYAVFSEFSTWNNPRQVDIPLKSIYQLINTTIRLISPGKIPQWRHNSPQPEKRKINSYHLSEYKNYVFTDADYADDIAILTNTPNQTETLLHNLERAAAGIGLHVNAHKIEYMCYNQTGDISTVDGTSLKLVDKFTYLGSSIS